MSWKPFEREAAGYESWYSTPPGQRADQAERSLLSWLLAHFPSAKSGLEIGCGTGHFTGYLAGKGLRLVGLDRAPAMLAESRRRHPRIPVVLGNAHHLPFRDGSLDLVVFVVALEFLEDPETALTEAIRVASEGLVVIALNRWSLGGWYRRRDAYRVRHSLLSRARDETLISLRAMAMKAAGDRLREICWASTLFPDGLWRVRVPIPLGDVVGMAVVLWPRPYCRPVRGLLGTDAR